MQLDLLYNNSKTSYSSVDTEYDNTYQPGGTLLIVAGNAAGRVQTSESNDMGRFCLHAVRGRRDEGVLLSTA